MPLYNQFCPIAKAMEVLGDRWTMLIVREMLLGSTRFNELEVGLPGISRSLLVQRLRSLERVGLIWRETLASGRTAGYHLTKPGEELISVLEPLAEWGQRWANDDIRPEDMQPTLLMWDMRRRVNLERLPDRRVVVEFEFHGLKMGRYWLVLDHGDVSVCFKYPGFDSDLFVTVDTAAMHRVWLGRLDFSDAIRDRLIEVEGPPALARSFPHWLALSSFAHIASAR